MKALTLSQPWAELVAAGRKQYETRSWRTSYRGPIAIHAGREGSGGMNPTVLAAHLRRFDLSREELAFGAVIAIAKIADCERTSDVADSISEEERAAGDFREGRFAWRLEEVQRLRVPVLMRGSLGLWTLPDWQLPDIWAAVRP